MPSCQYMRTFSQRRDKFVFSVAMMILFASTIWISSVSALPQQQTSLAVKITNPARGQQVAIGRNLTSYATIVYYKRKIGVEDGDKLVRLMFCAIEHLAW